MQNIPAISVIIPTYKRRDYVLEAIESVFAQTFTDYELIVVNDGSPDDTEAVLKPLADAGRIRYVVRANGGLAAARNSGLAVARGKYIALLDDDDHWPADKLAWQFKALEENPSTVLVYGYALRLDRPVMHSPPVVSAPTGNVIDAFSKGTWISSPGQTLIRADMLRMIGGFDAGLRAAEDWDMYIRLARVGAFLFINQCGLRYRIHEANMTRSWGRMYWYTRKVIRKNFPFGLRPGKLKAWYVSRRAHSVLTASILVHGAREASVRDCLCMCAFSVLQRPVWVVRRSHWRSMYSALMHALARQKGVQA